ncbi:MAG: amidohydrolase family protein [Anaerolineae bacterium]
MIETVGLPVIDVHCHPFPNRGELTAEEFTNLASFPGGSVSYMVEGGIPADEVLRLEIQAVRRNIVYFRYLIRQLAQFLKCEPTLERVVEKRNRAVAEYPLYVQHLFAEVGVSALVVDMGYPQPPLDRDQFVGEMPVPVIPIFRIEPLIVELLQMEIGWDEFRRRYDEAIADALENRGFRGLKSIIAYRTGLDISPLSRNPDQGRQALDAIRRGTGGGAVKKLRDHLFCRALELCIECDVPMQVHTGIGDYEVNLSLCRPGLLMDLLRFPAFRAARVVLVHSGYPYHAEAGYMANVLPRVYCDVSEGVPFAGGGARRIYAEVLEMAPLNKVVFGSDGFNLPEILYIGVKLGKTALAAALEDLVNERMLSEAEAQEAAGWILADNARRLYKLD